MITIVGPILTWVFIEFSSLIKERGGIIQNSHLVDATPLLPLLPGLLQPDLRHDPHQQLVDVVVDPCVQQAVRLYQL